MLFRDSLVALQLVHVLQVSSACKKPKAFQFTSSRRRRFSWDYGAIQFAVSFHPTQLHILMRVQKARHMKMGRLYNHQAPLSTGQRCPRPARSLPRCSLKPFREDYGTAPEPASLLISSERRLVLFDPSLRTFAMS